MGKTSRPQRAAKVKAEETILNVIATMSKPIGKSKKAKISELVVAPVDPPSSSGQPQPSQSTQSSSEPPPFFKFLPKEQENAVYHLAKGQSIESVMNGEAVTELLRKFGHVLFVYHPDDFGIDKTANNPLIKKVLALKNGFRLSQLTGEKTADGNKTQKVVYYTYKRLEKYVYEKTVHSVPLNELLSSVMSIDKIVMPSELESLKDDPIKYAEMFYNTLEANAESCGAHYLVLSSEIEIPGEDALPDQIAKLATELQLVAPPHVKNAKGIICSYCYISSGGVIFECHAEDLGTNSLSINYCGAVKFWLISPQRDSAKFRAAIQRAVQNHYPNAPPCILQHRKIFVHPAFLRENDIAFSAVVHRPGSAVLTAYDAIHSGHNQGICVAKAKNITVENYKREMKSSIVQCFCGKQVTTEDRIGMEAYDLENFGKLIGAPSAMSEEERREAFETQLRQRVTQEPESAYNVPAQVQSAQIDQQRIQSQHQRLQGGPPPPPPQLQPQHDQPQHPAQWTSTPPTQHFQPLMQNYPPYLPPPSYYGPPPSHYGPPPSYYAGYPYAQAQSPYPAQSLYPAYPQYPSHSPYPAAPPYLAPPSYQAQYPNQQHYFAASAQLTAQHQQSSPGPNLFSCAAQGSSLFEIVDGEEKKPDGGLIKTSRIIAAIAPGQEFPAHLRPQSTYNQLVKFVADAKPLDQLMADAGDKLQCPICDDVLKTRQNLRNHIKLHVEPIRYKCDADGCTLSYTAMASLKAHKLKDHEGIRFKCAHCDLAFAYKNKRDAHERKKHPNATKMLTENGEAGSEEDRP